MNETEAQAILARMRTVTMGLTPLAVGDAVAPKSGSPSQIVAPCSVLYGRDGGSFVDTLCGDRSEGEAPFQTTSVGKSASEARTVDAKVRAELEGSPLTVSGRWVRVKSRFPGARVERDDSVTPTLFYVPRQYIALSLQAT